MYQSNFADSQQPPVTMSSPSMPAVLIVHGGFVLPDSWTECIECLSKAGFTTRCPRLPTCGDSRPPKATIQDDIDAVRSVARELVDAGYPIIVIAHSWGGLVMSEAIREDLYAKQLSDGGPPGAGVVHLIYLSAWLLLPGKSPADAYRGDGYPSKMNVGFNEDGTAWLKNAPEALYNDMEAERATELANKTVTFNWAEVQVKAYGNPWRDIPTTFVHCTQDQAIEPGHQKHLVREAIEIGGAKTIRTETCDSGHSAFAGKPSDVVRIVEKVWASSQGQ